MKLNKLSDKEQSKINDFCDKLRINIKNECGLNKISGGFCNVDFTACDKKFIYLTVLWGVSDDSGISKSEEIFKLNRDTLVILDILARGIVNLNECEEGDVLISALGRKLVYLRPTEGNEYLDHVVRYLKDDDSIGGYGTRTNDGYVFARKRHPETDHDIIEIIKKQKDGQT